MREGCRELEFQMPFFKVRVIHLDQLDGLRIAQAMPGSFYPLTSAWYHVYMAGLPILTLKPKMNYGQTK